MVFEFYYCWTCASLPRVLTCKLHLSADTATKPVQGVNCANCNEALQKHDENIQPRVEVMQRLHRHLMWKQLAVTGQHEPRKLPPTTHDELKTNTCTTPKNILTCYLTIVFYFRTFSQSLCSVPQMRRGILSGVPRAQGNWLSFRFGDQGRALVHDLMY